MSFTDRSNQGRILRALRQCGPLARVDLGEIVGLSPASVSGITAQLIREGRLRARSTEDQGVLPGGNAQGRGRPKVAIELEPRAASVIAVKLSMDEIQVALGDYAGGTARTETYAVETRNLDAKAVIAEVAQAIQRFREHLPRDTGDCIGIGVAVQGLVQDGKRLVWSPALGVRDLDLVTPLGRRFGLPVLLDNDANCIALAIRNRPGAAPVENLAVIMLGIGVGMGLILGGRLYTGKTGAGAEFGHSKYLTDGPLCACGKRGCVESFASDYALYRDARMMLHLPGADVSHPSQEQMQRLADMARAGNAAAIALFDQAGRALGFGLANLIALLGPDLVLISGSGVRAYDLLEPAMRRSLGDNLVETLLAATPVNPHPWDEDLTLRGIVAQVLDAAI